MKLRTISRAALRWVALSTILAVSLTYIAVSASDASSTSVKVCVNKSSKAVFYKKTCSKHEFALQIGPSVAGLSAYEIWVKAGNTGTESDFLHSLKGADGSNSYSDNSWNIGTNCSQKLALALSAGQKLAFKSIRNNFESTTGCIVEKILGTHNEDLKAAGLPYIESISRLDFGEPGSGGGSILDVKMDQSYRVEYKVRIRKLAEAQTRYGSPLAVCTTTDSDLINIDRPQSVIATANPDEFIVSTYLRASSFDNSFEAPLYLALCDNEYPDYMALRMYAAVFEDPALLVMNLNPGFEATYARIWGWSY